MASSITLTLTGRAAERLEELLGPAGFPTPEAAVEQALECFVPKGDPEIESWLRNVVAERYDRAHEDPTKLLSVAEVRASLFGKS